MEIELTPNKSGIVADYHFDHPVILNYAITKFPFQIAFDI